MSGHQSRNPGGRLTRTYSTPERAAIDVFKADYMSATSAAARKTIAQVHIFPALFNYWASIGQPINQQDMKPRAEELLGWLRNVWRVKKAPQMIKGTKYRLSDILWWTREDIVFAEIAHMMGIESADRYTDDWFKYRTPAMKEILGRMTDIEKSRLREQAEAYAANGLPAAVQRKFVGHGHICGHGPPLTEINRLVEEKWYSRFTADAQKRYCDMGLLALSIVAYTNKKGQWVVEIHDKVATTLGVTSRSFEETYDDKAKDIKRAMLEYVTTLLDRRRADYGADGTAAAEDGMTLRRDVDGWPMVPCPESWITVTKEQLEPLYRTYIARHYALASRVEARQAPFSAIAAKQSDFIAAEYLPSGITLGDPRGMGLSHMIKFFQHIAGREKSHGVKYAFRFKSVLSSRKRGTHRPASYPDMGQPLQAQIDQLQRPPRIQMPARAGTADGQRPAATPADAPMTTFNSTWGDPGITVTIQEGWPQWRPDSHASQGPPLRFQRADSVQADYGPQLDPSLEPFFNQFLTMPLIPDEMNMHSTSALPYVPTGPHPAPSFHNEEFTDREDYNTANLGHGQHGQTDTLGHTDILGQADTFGNMEIPGQTVTPDSYLSPMQVHTHDDRAATVPAALVRKSKRLEKGPPSDMAADKGPRRSQRYLGADSSSAKDKRKGKGRA